VELKDELIKYIQEEFSAPELDAQTGLITTGIIDSFGILELISHIETHYGLCIEAKDMVIDNFQSVSAIASLIQRKKA